MEERPFTGGKGGCCRLPTPPSPRSRSRSRIRVESPRFQSVPSAWDAVDIATRADVAARSAPAARDRGGSHSERAGLNR